MSEQKKVDLENLPPEDRELTPEEQEAVKGGRISLPAGTKPKSGSIESDPCQGGETRSP